MDIAALQTVGVLARNSDASLIACRSIASFGCLSTWPASCSAAATIELARDAPKSLALVVSENRSRNHPCTVSALRQRSSPSLSFHRNNISPGAAFGMPNALASGLSPMIRRIRLPPFPKTRRRTTPLVKATSLRVSAVAPRPPLSREYPGQPRAVKQCHRAGESGCSVCSVSTQLLCNTLANRFQGFAKVSKSLVLHVMAGLGPACVILVLEPPRFIQPDGVNMDFRVEREFDLIPRRRNGQLLDTRFQGRIPYCLRASVEEREALSVSHTVNGKTLGFHIMKPRAIRALRRTQHGDTMLDGRNTPLVSYQ